MTFWCKLGESTVTSISLFKTKICPTFFHLKNLQKAIQYMLVLLDAYGYN